MDFFDPQKQKRHNRRLSIGYVIIGTVLLLATTILLHLANGYGLDRQGRVIQNGLVFVSTRPSGAEIYLNGTRQKSRTNARLNMPAGKYVLELKRKGYHDWKRALHVEGGKLQRFDYPFLFPLELNTEVVRQYESAPVLSTQSIDRRWLLIASNQENTFELYDLNAKEPEARQVAVPAEILAAGSTTIGWQTVEWSKDNRRVILQRSYERDGQSGSEYILFDRERPEESQNLTVLFGFNPTEIELRDQVYDRYYLYDQNSGQVFTASLREPTPQPYISDVLAFTTEKDIVTFVTAKGADEGKVLIRIKQGDGPTMTIREVPAGTAYLLDMAEYEGDFYLAVGAASENRVFVYRDPLGSLRRAPNEPLVPVQILKVSAPNHVSFSANKRFVIAENGDKFAVYDIEEDRGYAYQAAAAPDAPRAHAVWMDGFRLAYVSGGKLVVFDYDGTNMHSLSAASPNYRPIFDHDYRYLYTIDDKHTLTSTALLTPEDL
ncbi:PEGA domain-containing protein [Candidatus Saccharibacteria bacterium]|nr:PEGA domain-containing protein [Candidatus Saccharibacteria bacterium]